MSVIRVYYVSYPCVLCQLSVCIMSVIRVYYVSYPCVTAAVNTAFEQSTWAKMTHLATIHHRANLTPIVCQRNLKGILTSRQMLINCQFLKFHDVSGNCKEVTKKNDSDNYLWANLSEPIYTAVDDFHSKEARRAKNALGREFTFGAF
jgi:hypothetical protein